MDGIHSCFEARDVSICFGNEIKDGAGVWGTIDGGIQDGKDGRAHSGTGRLQSLVLAVFCVTPPHRHQVDV